MEPWQWAWVALTFLVVWPPFVFVTGAVWAAGQMAGELRYIETLNDARKGGKDGGDGL